VRPITTSFVEEVCRDFDIADESSAMNVSDETVATVNVRQ
jgi:hypothetical protein